MHCRIVGIVRGRAVLDRRGRLRLGRGLGRLVEQSGDLVRIELALRRLRRRWLLDFFLHGLRRFFLFHRLFRQRFRRLLRRRRCGRPRYGLRIGFRPLDFLRWLRLFDRRPFDFRQTLQICQFIYRDEIDRNGARLDHGQLLGRRKSHQRHRHHQTMRGDRKED